MMNAEYSDSPPDDEQDQNGLQPDDLELEGYVLQREITRGGQAIIFSAIKKSTGRKVAVKFFPGGSYATRKEKVRMDREVRVLAALDHPNIVSVIDRGQTPDGSTYFVLEYVHGETLAEYIDSYWEQKGQPQSPDDLKELLHLFVRIAEAVNAAHLRGVVHRDLKPSNIIVDGYGEPHILDFGVALSAVPLMDDEGEPLPSVTWTGEFLGSVQWASPEQAEGDQAKIDVRSDVYSLGVVLYEILTGDFPYDVFGTLPHVLKNIVESKPRPPGEVFMERVADMPPGEEKTSKPGVCPIDPVLDEIVLRSLEKNREDRFQTAGEFAKAISTYLAGKTVSLRRPLVRRRKLLPVLWTAAAAALLVVGAVAITRWHLTRDPAGRPDPQDRTGGLSSVHHLNVFGYRIDGDEVVFEFDPRDYDVARMADGSLGQVGDVPSISRVSVAGLFNEWEWRDPAWFMERVLRNRFELRKPLSLFAGRSEWPFKFVLNDQVWVSAPRVADNKEVVVEDTATYNLLLANPREREGEEFKALRAYRERINRIWPGQGENLVLDARGAYHLTLTHVDARARIQRLDVLNDIPLASLNLGAVRVADLTALAGSTSLNWFVCADPTFNALFFGMQSALRDRQWAVALEEAHTALKPFEGVPAFDRARALYAHSLEGLLALEQDPEAIPESARLFEDRRYLFVAQPMTWPDARLFAEEHGGMLASVRSTELRVWLTEEFGWPTFGRTIWLGGTDEQVRGSWGWLAADPWLYEHWSPGYPDREDDRTRALGMKYDGWWINLDGYATPLPFLIEWRLPE